jgi:hypothetical protein
MFNYFCTPLVFNDILIIKYTACISTETGSIENEGSAAGGQLTKIKFHLP